MKPILIFLAAILITAGLFAQTPAKMTYQAIIRNANGELVSTQVGMRISILQGTDVDTASEVYSESLTPSPNQNGLLNVEFGGETGWDAINWSEGTYFIKTETDLTGGSNYTITGISQLLSVPYALHAKTAETATNIRLRGSETAFEGWDKNENDDFSGNYNDLSNLPDLNNFLRAEQDGDVTNELQILSINGDTIYLSNGGGFVKLPPNNGFSGSYYDLTDLPPNLDTDSTDDFSGNYNDLSNLPTIPDTSSLARQSELEDLRTSLDKLSSDIDKLKIKDTLQSDLTDSRDNNIYRVVKIGEQIWMSENLAYLPEVQNNADFASKGSNSEPAYGVYGYDGGDLTAARAETNYETYGVLYNWYAIDLVDICPEGWHVPTDNEWTELENYLISNGHNYDRTISDNKIGKAMASESGWTIDSQSGGAVGFNQRYNNSSGFSALPGGIRRTDGRFISIKDYGLWWSSSTYLPTASDAYARYLFYFHAYLLDNHVAKGLGYSVRCLRD